MFWNIVKLKYFYKTCFYYICNAFRWGSVSIDDFGESVSIFSEKTNCMMTSNRNILHNSDNYELCIRKLYQGEPFFALLRSKNKAYQFKSSCSNSTNRYPEQQIYHTSKFFWPLITYRIYNRATSRLWSYHLPSWYVMKFFSNKEFAKIAL